MDIDIKWAKLKIHFEHLLLKEQATELQFDDPRNAVSFNFKGRTLNFNAIEASCDESYCSRRGGRDEQELYKSMKQILNLHIADSKHPTPREELDFGN